MAMLQACAVARPVSAASAAGNVEALASSFKGLSVRSSLAMAPLCIKAQPALQIFRRIQVLPAVSAAGYKLKSHKASAKRFSVTGSGKITRRQAGRAHLLRKKTTKRKNRLSGKTDVQHCDWQNVIGALPYLKTKK